MFFSFIAFVEQTTESMTNATDDNSTQAVTTAAEATTTTPEQKIFYIVVDPTTTQVQIYDNSICECNFNITEINYTRIL